MTIIRTSLKTYWGDRWGSNPRQQESQSWTLPTELRSPSIPYRNTLLKTFMYTIILGCTLFEYAMQLAPHNAFLYNTIQKHTFYYIAIVFRRLLSALILASRNPNLEKYVFVWHSEIYSDLIASWARTNIGPRKGIS